MDSTADIHVGRPFPGLGLEAGYLGASAYRVQLCFLDSKGKAGMNLFLIVPKNGQASELAAQLAKTVGASRIPPDRTMAILAMIGGADGTFPRWSLLEVPSAEPGRLKEISQFVSQQVEANGIALVDLDERLISVAELQEAALGLGLDVELVAIVKHQGKEPSSLTPPYNAVMDALAALGGRCVSTGRIARHLGVRHDIIRRRLALLVQWRRIVQEGQKGGSRYSLVGEAPVNPGRAGEA